MFSKILIANRGEIACRVVKTARRLGIKTVAVCSDADRNARHVALADEAVHIGPSPARDSYLVADKIIAAAKRTGAEAIHPGYGFLSENADFAQACAAARIAFVGPTPDQLKLFGDKARARAQAQKSKVPVLPGTGIVDLAGAAAFFKKHAKAGIALKAIAGGGGAACA